MTQHPLLPSKDHGFLTPYVFFSNNWISMCGVVLVTAAAVLWLFVLPAGLRTEQDNPYLGILLFLVLPAAFFLGLLLIPAGIFLRHRKLRAAGRIPAELPPVDVRNPQLRRIAAFVAATTCVNLVIGSTFTYKAVHYMDSATICGKTCHSLMLPEYTAYQNSPHARVACAACHIGPGASWFVKSKLSGTWQVFATVLNTYPRPIPTPVENLRPARETCEQCHWPEKFGSARVRVRSHYAADETNTVTKTVLLVKIGGGGEPGIHGAHVGQGIRIRYAHADAERQEIPWVEVTRADGSSAVYRSGDAPEEEISKLPVREMDCIDCHNRPSHTFSPPERALDEALAAGEVPADLPWIKKLGLELLTEGEYPSRDEAIAQIPAKLAERYQSVDGGIFEANREKIRRAGEAIAAIHGRNVFPEMKVNWGTYPNHIGHEDSPGCYRCHDGAHTNEAGAEISQDCSTCHELLAYGEEEPEVLSTLGIGR